MVSRQQSKPCTVNPSAAAPTPRRRPAAPPGGARGVHRRRAGSGPLKDLRGDGSRRFGKHGVIEHLETVVLTPTSSSGPTRDRRRDGTAPARPGRHADLRCRRHGLDLVLEGIADRLSPRLCAAARTIRTDIGPTDLSAALEGIALTSAGPEQRQQAERLLALTLDGASCAAIHALKPSSRPTASASCPDLSTLAWTGHPGARACAAVPGQW